MSFSRSAAANVVPLMARVLFAGLMVPMGWTMLTNQATYRGEDLEWLQKLGVVESAGLESASFVASQDPSSSSVPPASESSGAGGSEEPPPPAVGPGVVEPADPQPTAVEGSESDGISGEEPTVQGPAIEPVPGDEEGVEARRLFGYAVVFAKAGWPMPKLLAWSCAFLMLVGGSLLLLGLLTRMWGLLFAIASGSLFWIESWPIVAEQWMFGVDDASFLLISAQATLAVLGLGLALSGGGLLSLDHAIFRSRDGGADPAPTAA